MRIDEDHVSNGFVNSRLVHIIVDSLYGDKLCGLSADEPIWIIESEVNRPVIEGVWKERRSLDRDTNLTSFKSGKEKNLEIVVPEDILVAQLWAIELHHGECATGSPYLTLNVIGTGCSDRVREALSEYGFIECEETSEGFMARKR